MKKVLQIFGKLGRGGLETFVMNLYKAIDKESIQFDFLLTAPGGDYEREAKALGATIHYIPPRFKGIKQYKASLESFFKKHAHEYSAVHLHVSSLSSIEPLKYAKEYGIPIRIIHSHSSSVKQNLKGRLLHRMLHCYNKLRISKLATHYLGCSDKALDWLFKGTGIRSKAVMINNGIDTSLYKYNDDIRLEVRHNFALSDEFVIGHVGSFIHVKNHEFLIKLFGAIHQKAPNSKLILVGGGELESQIKQQIKGLGLESNVIFTGLRSDVHKILQAIDLIIMPSFFEGLPVSLVEAQASGLPVIASDTISKDVAITPNIKFLSLSDVLDKWVNTSLQIASDYERTDTSAIIIKNGFDIYEIANRFNIIYNSNNE